EFPSTTAITSTPATVITIYTPLYTNNLSESKNKNEAEETIKQC
ncbi:16007_t:CDS:1, partial [Funneliformis caledonium]